MIRRYVAYGGGCEIGVTTTAAAPPEGTSRATDVLARGDHGSPLLWSSVTAGRRRAVTAAEGRPDPSPVVTQRLAALTSCGCCTAVEQHGCHGYSAQPAFTFPLREVDGVAYDDVAALKSMDGARDARGARPPEACVMRFAHAAAGCRTG